MTFKESSIFPERISFGAAGGPGYQTDVVVVNSGFESRNVNWAQARCKWDVGHRGRGPADTETLIRFFREMKGRAHGFRFKDWTDYNATISNTTLTNISGDTYQLQRAYDTGLTELRAITKPRAGVVVYKNGVDVTSDTTIDFTNGQVEWNSSAPTGGDVLTWSGEFDIPARFDTDQMQLEIVDKNIYSWGSIPIIEIRV